MAKHYVEVGPLPRWLDAERLLGPGDWRWIERVEGWFTEARLPTATAADVATRLRKVGLDGQLVKVDVRPRLDRSDVRKARTEDARRRRDTTPGFIHPGAETDDEGRWSLTPEAMALSIGRAAAQAELTTVVDACAGAGGSAIGFARAGVSVIAIEADERRAALLEKNARLYEVSDKIEVRVGRLQAVLPELQFELQSSLLFADPPWGREWNRERTEAEDLPLLESVLRHRERFAETWLKLPPSFDTRTLPGARPTAMFGEAAGDARRIKFLLVQLDGTSGRQPA